MVPIKSFFTNFFKWQAFLYKRKIIIIITFIKTCNKRKRMQLKHMTRAVIITENHTKHTQSFTTDTTVKTSNTFG